MRTPEDITTSLPAPSPLKRNRRGRRRLFSAITTVAALVLIAATVIALLVSHAGEPSAPGKQGTAATKISTIIPTGNQGWVALPHLTHTPDMPVLAPSDPRVVYEVVLPDGTASTPVTLQRSDDDGAHWQRLPVPSEITEVSWAAFFVNPLAAHSVFLEVNTPCPGAQADANTPGGALSSESGVCTFDYFSTDGGADWSRVQWPVPGSDTTRISLGGLYPLSPFKAQGNRLYAVLALGSGYAHRFVTSTDGGATWQTADDQIVATGKCLYTYAPTPTGSTVFGISQSRCNVGSSAPDISLVSPEAGGGGTHLWRTDDAGAHWTEVGPFVGGPDLQVSLDSTGQPVLYDDEFLGADPNSPSTATKISLDGGQTWQPAPLGKNNQYANGDILGMLGDGAIIEVFTDSAIQQRGVFAWKAGDAAWQQLAGDFSGTPQYLLVVHQTGGAQETLWLVSGNRGNYSVQWFTPQ
jgi:hypothetical protein